MIGRSDAERRDDDGDERYDAALDRAAVHARAWLGSVRDRAVPPVATTDEILDRWAAICRRTASPRRR